MPKKLSLDKKYIKVLLLEGIHPSSVKSFESAGYTNVEYMKTALDGNELEQKLKDINYVFTTRRINIAAQYLQTDAEIGYVIIDAECNNSDKILKELKAIPHTIRARMLY